MDFRDRKAAESQTRAAGVLGIALILAGRSTPLERGNAIKDLSDVLLQSHAAAIETALEETVGAIRGA